MKTALNQSNDEMKGLRNTVTEIEMVYHHKVKAIDRPKVQCSQDSDYIFRKLWSAQMGLLEECHMLLLDRSSRVLGHTLISKGSFHVTLVDPKVIFAFALKGRASAFVIAHNHPSGNLKPSRPDIQITNKLLKGGKLLDLPLADHLILSPEGGYFSFADEGLLEDIPF